MGLIVGDPIVTDSVIVASGAKLEAGAVLGMDGNGKFKLSAKSATDGSEKPYAVLLESVDATATDKIVPVLLMGQVDIDELSFGDGWDKESLKTALRGIGIFAKKTL